MTHRRTAKAERMTAGGAYSGKVVDPADLLQDVIRPGDRSAGGRQPEAGRLPVEDAGRLRPEAPQRPTHADLLGVAVRALDLFELGIAKKVDFAFAGPQSLRVAQLLEDGVHIGAIHTYVELYARLLVDLAPNVVLVCAEQADRDGNLYTGAEYRRHTRDRRGCRISRRNRDRAGERDRGHNYRASIFPALGGRRGGSGSPLRGGTAFHP